MYKKSLFLISNGSSETFSNNTLTKFSNKLPEILELPENEKYEISVESIGFSCLFRNIKLPENDFYPSFMVTNCVKSFDMTRGGKCHYNQPEQLVFNEEICKAPLEFKFIANEDGNNCYWYMGKFSEKYYTQEDLNIYFDSINRECNTNIKFIDGLLQFGREFDQPWYWVMIHPTMMETFGFEANMYLKYKYNRQVDFKDIFSSGDSVVDVIKEADGTESIFWRKKIIERLVNYNGEMYFAFQIGIFTDFLKSTKKDITQRSFPRVVKLQSNNIEQQIFNNSFSNDLVVFCPDFKRYDDYYFHEFESKQYVPILNSTITDFEIKICDEDNLQLQLLPGVPTILKVDLRKMSTKRSFNVRITSMKTKEFRSNTNYSFRVKLPNVLSLDDNWRVALTSISHPNVFKSFLTNKNNRGILVRQNDGPVISKQAAKIYSDLVYSRETIVKELKDFFDINKFGSISLSEDYKLSITFKKSGSFIASNNLLRVFGYNEKINYSDNATEVAINKQNPNIIVNGTGESETYTLKFGSPINEEILKPNYMIAYTNFIKSSIIGGIYSKILRVIPLTNKEKGFVINEFKHNEYLELQNTEISEIEIILRSHDGEYVNFGTEDDVILNLEFTNSFE